jgi:hypothetical protein
VITYQQWDRARKRAYPNANHMDWTSRRKEDDSILATWGPPDKPYIRLVTLKEMERMGLTLEEEIQALAEDWINYDLVPTGDEAHDAGKEMGVMSCGEKLLEVLRNRGLLK